MKFVDLFCGIGGFHIALTNLGHKCVWACDIDPDCRQVYYDNFGIMPEKDITKVSVNSIPDHDILCAGFPCQSFSHAGKQQGFKDKTRGTLFSNIIDILECKKPKYFILENVKNLKTHDKGNTLKTIYNALCEVGYDTYEDPLVVSPLHVGVPQNRDRVFIIGVRKPLSLPDKPHFTKKKTSIYDVMDSHVGSDITKKEILDGWEEFIQHFRKKNIKLPTFPIWTEYFVDNHNVDQYPEWKAKFIKQNMEFYGTNKAFLKKWLINMRKISDFKNSMAKLEWQCGAFEKDDSLWNLLFQYRPSGIRVKRTNYSPALVAMNQIVFVGKYRRKMLPREVARLQSFPDDFKLCSNDNKTYKQFGNSVNVAVVTMVANHLLQS